MGVKAESEILMDFWKIESERQHKANRKNLVLQNRQRSWDTQTDRFSGELVGAGTGPEPSIQKANLMVCRQPWGLWFPSLLPTEWTTAPWMLCP